VGRTCSYPGVLSNACWLRIFYVFVRVTVRAAISEPAVVLRLWADRRYDNCRGVVAVCCATGRCLSALPVVFSRCWESCAYSPCGVAVCHYVAAAVIAALLYGRGTAPCVRSSRSLVTSTFSGGICAFFSCVNARTAVFAPVRQMTGSWAGEDRRDRLFAETIITRFIRETAGSAYRRDIMTACLEVCSQLCFWTASACLLPVYMHFAIARGRSLNAMAALQQHGAET